MSSVVQELQRDLINGDVLLSSSLKKAYLISKKLNLKDLSVWLDNELNGYKCDFKDIPEYRNIKGIFKGFNPLHGWQTIPLVEQELEDILLNNKTSQSISEIESLISQKEDSMMLPHPSSMIDKLISSGYITQLATWIDKSALIGIIESVKMTLLDWTLELEKEDIQGFDLIFTKEEKEKAMSNTNITNFINNGGVQQNQSNTENSTQNQNVYNTDRLNEFIQAYKKDKSKLDLSEGAGAYLDENIADLESELSQDSPNESVIKKCLASAKNVLEGCIGNVAASVLLQMI